MNKDLPFLDVDVPMYAAGQEHPSRASSVWLMTEITEGRMDVVIDTQIVQEVLYRYGALRKWKIGIAVATNLLDIVPKVFPILPRDVRLAIQIFEKHAPKGVKARESLHAAVMHNHGITNVISTDTHFDLIEGVTRLDPRSLFAKAKG